jgi:hypothetical protein
VSGKSGFSAQALLVLAALCEQQSGWCNGSALARHTGLKSGTLYPIFTRLADRGLAGACQQDEPPARPAARAARTQAGAVALAES